MRVLWQTRARNSFQEIANYVKCQFGMKSRREYVEKVHQQEKLLRKSPYIGSIDPLFADRAATYRSVIIKGLSKMVYRVEENTIHIVAFWDTRREPKAQANKVEE